MWRKIKDDPSGAALMTLAAMFYAIGLAGCTWAMWQNFADTLNGQVPSPRRYAEAALPLMVLASVSTGFLAGHAYRGWTSGDQ
jgi:hypothetical protein